MQQLSSREIQTRIFLEIEKEFAEKALGAENAAAHGYIDRILTFADTRKYLIDAFEILATKEVY